MLKWSLLLAALSRGNVLGLFRHLLCFFGACDVRGDFRFFDHAALNAANGCLVWS